MFLPTSPSRHTSAYRGCWLLVFPGVSLVYYTGSSMQTMTQIAIVVQGREGLLSTRAHENVSIVQDAPLSKPSDGEALVKMLLR